jgi:hypothetical protein
MQQFHVLQYTPIKNTKHAVPMDQMWEQIA